MTEAIVGEPQYINPLLAPLSDVDADLTSLIFSSLFTYSSTQELQQDLVTAYQLSEDGLTYTFTLRQDVKWHDRTPFDVDDVLFTITAIHDPLYQSPLIDSLKGVQATRVDDYTFSLTLQKPFAPFLSLLTFSILPEHLWFDVTPQNVTLTELNIKPIGSGPFRFHSLKKDQNGAIKSLRLVSHQDFYGQRAYLDELNFLFYPDAQSALEAVESKKAESMSIIPTDARKELQKKNGDIQLHTMHFPQYTGLFFNQKQTSLLQEQVIRKVLAFSLQRDAIVAEALQGQGEPITSPVLPWYPGYTSEIEQYAFNVEESIRLLEEAGWKYPETLPTDGTFIPREKEGKKLEFTISTVDVPEYQQVALVLQQQWQRIGCKVNVDTYSREDIQTQIIRTRNYEALLFAEITGADADPFAFWHSGQQVYPGLGLSIFRNKQMDQLLEDARRKTKPEERASAYTEFQKLFATELPALLLYHPWYPYGVHRAVSGVPEQLYLPTPAERFGDVTSWYSETQRVWK